MSDALGHLGTQCVCVRACACVYFKGQKEITQVIVTPQYVYSGVYKCGTCQKRQ